MGVLDKIKQDRKGIKTNTESLIIEQTLNKLFFCDINPEEEIKMLKMQYKQKNGDRYGLHASSMLASEKEFCYRKQVLSLFYKQIQGENIPIGLKRLFEEGNFIGEKWQRLFIRGGLGKAEDMDRSLFWPEYDLSYTPDAIIKIGKNKYVVEIKSQNTFTFKKATSHPGGMKQLKFYMYLTGIHRGFVLVEDKNDQSFKIYIAEYDPAELDTYIERLEYIQVYKERFQNKKKMVKRLCKRDNIKRAKECNMRDACWNLGMGRIKLDV